MEIPNKTNPLPAAKVTIKLNLIVFSAYCSWNRPSKFTLSWNCPNKMVFWWCILVVYRVAVFIAEEREKPVVDREKKWLLVNRGL